LVLTAGGAQQQNRRGDYVVAFACRNKRSDDLK
jgi:hypothetical protein